MEEIIKLSCPKSMWRGFELAIEQLGYAIINKNISDYNTDYFDYEVEIK